MKTIRFDAISISIDAKNNRTFSVDADVEYIDEILDCFTPDEIINKFSDLDALYNALKRYYSE